MNFFEEIAVISFAGFSVLAGIGATALSVAGILAGNPESTATLILGIFLIAGAYNGLMRVKEWIDRESNHRVRMFWYRKDSEKMRELEAENKRLKALVQTLGGGSL
jgi:hypothetical protein